MTRARGAEGGARRASAPLTVPALAVALASPPQQRAAADETGAAEQQEQ